MFFSGSFPIPTINVEWFIYWIHVVFFQKNIMPDIYNSNTTVSKSSGMEPPIKKYMYHFSGPLHDVHPAHQMHPRDQMIWRHHFFLTLDDALVSQEHTVLFFENHLCFFYYSPNLVWRQMHCCWKRCGWKCFTHGFIYIQSNFHCIIWWCDFAKHIY